MKLGNDNEKPRFPESEGFYIGKKPYMTIKNKNLMTDRLLKLYDKVSSFLISTINRVTVIKSKYLPKINIYSVV